MWLQILAVLAVVGLVWFFFSFKKTRPDLFTKQNLSKSFTTIGVLALILIAFVALLVFISK